MDTVLVTGASGFLGGRIYRAFAHSRGPQSVRCLVRTQEHARPLRDQGFQVSVGDLTDPGLSESLVAGCDVVVHAAAFMSPGTREEVFAVNVHATQRLAAAAASASVTRFVFLSSIEAYGDFADRTLTETEPHRPVPYPYAQSKHLAEQLIAESFHAAGSEAFTHLRPGMVYGPHSPYWTHRYLDQARTGRIRVLGLTPSRAGRVYPVHQDDLVQAVITATTQPQAAGQNFNLVNDENLTWWDWALAHHTLVGDDQPQRRPLLPYLALDRLHRFTGRPPSHALRSQLRRATIPHDKARRLLGWQPRSFTHGMSDVQRVDSPA